MNSFNHMRKVWLWSLACFIVAGFTGVLYRWGMTGSLPYDLSLQNVRHAHSHLMFFCWITPVPMAFITQHLSGFTNTPVTGLKRSTWAVVIIGLLSYPFFLIWGYRPANFGFTELPVSVILSGFVMIAWYFYIWFFIKARKDVPRSIVRSFYEASLFMLVLSSFGAWGVALMQFGGIENPLYGTALTHFFLSTFTEGWAVLMAVGLMYEHLKPDMPRINTSWLIAPVVLGIPLLFPFGIPSDLLNPSLLISARVGAISVSAGLLANLYILSKSKLAKIWWWRVILILFGAKILLQFTAAITPSVFWIGEHGLRIFYLHTMLLGFLTLLYFGVWHTHFILLIKTGFKLLIISVLLLLISLVFVSGWWPAEWLPENIFEIVAIAAILPVIASVVEWMLFYKYAAGNHLNPEKS
jgi:hypothetical protein